MKKLICTLYTLVIVCIGFATIIEKYKGTDFVGLHLYGAWWFSALWAVLTALSCVYLYRRKVYKNFAVTLLHLSFVVILMGAFVTHTTSRHGSISLRIGEPCATYTNSDGTRCPLPFTLVLKEFRVVNYPGTDAPLDYQSLIACGYDAAAGMMVSMNHIGRHSGYRFFQQAYDSDGLGVTLGVGYDPYGIAITYSGYLLLLLGILATLWQRRSYMQKLYRDAVRPRMAVLLFMAAMGGTCAAVEPPLQTVDKEICSSLSTVSVLYNNRICPMGTVATDFVRKLCGSSSWHGYSSDEIFVSWMIFYSPWEHQKIIRIKSRDVQRLLGLQDEWAAYSDFLDAYHEYKLKHIVDSLHQGYHTGISRKALLDADEKFQVVEMFYRGSMLRMFPYGNGDHVEWFTPGAHALPEAMPVKEQFFVKQSMDFLTESIVTGQKSRSLEIVQKIKLFQRHMIGSLLPTAAQTRVELFYNSLSALRWPVFLSLAVTLLLCLLASVSWWIGRSRWLRSFSAVFACILLCFLSLQLGLRWWISHHPPVSNGHETMLFMAWALLIVGLLFRRRMPILLCFASLGSAFCMLVAMLAGGSTQISPLMPVLQSPLLSLHVATIMCAYALFALQLLLAVRTLLLPAGDREEALRTASLSWLLLYPAVFLLAIGIFLGAVWANVSWGTYWSWDPKETWALITLMVYAVPFHRQSLPWLQNPRNYSIYMLLSFLTILMTYFGVNFLLGGKHSYLGA